MAAPTVAAIGIAAATSSHDPLLYLTEMMHLAEDGVMFTIARFEKTIQLAGGPGKSLAFRAHVRGP